MSDTYKLHYFNGRGLAEPARMLFVVAGVAFEDVRFQREEWPNHQNNYPFGTVPALEINGKIAFNQSKSIILYLGKKFEMMGSNAMEEAQIMEIAMAIGDANQDNRKLILSEDPELKEKARAEVKANHIFYFEALEAFVKPLVNNGFLIGGKLSLADLLIFCQVDMVEQFGFDLKEVLANAPSLEATYIKVGSIESIKAWIEKRPKTPF